MIQYWSWWNFSWFIGSELGILQKSNALKVSIITTSLLGGYMTYVYPRKIIIRIKNKKYSPNYKILVLSDWIVHQAPLISILILNRAKIENGCGKNVLIPCLCWGIMNYYNEVNFDKLYGIKMYKLVSVSSILLCGYGFCYHYIHPVQQSRHKNQ